MWMAQKNNYFQFNVASLKWLGAVKAVQERVIQQSVGAGVELEWVCVITGLGQEVSPLFSIPISCIV